MTATRPSRAERVAEARRLREAGLLLRQIGERMGVAVQTVHDYLNDPDRSRVRARRENYRGVCEDCGAETNGAEGRGPNAPARCRSCNQKLTGAQQTATHEWFASYIVARWGEGATGREIAQELGCATRTVNKRVSTLRAEGYDLPYRRPPHMIENGRRMTRMRLARQAERAGAA